MDILSLLLNGFAIAFEPLNLALIILGCTVGLFIGAMPGLGSVNGVNNQYCKGRINYPLDANGNRSITSSKNQKHF